MIVNDTTIRKKLQNVFAKNTRKGVLDLRMHFVSLDESLLTKVLGQRIRLFNSTLGTDDEFVSETSIQEIVTKIIVFAKARHKNPVIQIENPETWTELLENPKARLPAIVTLGNQTVGILYSSYTRAYNGLFKPFIRKELVKYVRNSHYEARKKEKQDQIAQGQKVSEGDIKKGFDIGHLAGNKAYTITPLQEKLNLLEDEMSNIINSLENGQNQQALQQVLKQVQLAEKTLLDKSSYGASLTLQKDLDGFLTTVGAVLVVPQDALENRYFYGTKVEAELEKLISDLLLTLNFSRNLVEEVTHAVQQSILNLKPATKKKSIRQLDFDIKKSIKVKTKTTTTAKQPVTQPKKLVQRTQVQQPSNLSSLQMLLNARIVEQVKKNMGSGDRRDILNLRTGRFAESVMVTRLTQSRQGMISAFYTYMKYPYATFSAGGEQDSPKTRDPKLLISKSIREIAQEQAYNKLRAILA